MPVPAPSGTKTRELPGFYYGKYQPHALIRYPQPFTLLTHPTDEEKKRYFRIEAGRTAPSSAAWSAENVKKRKAEKQMAVREQKRMEKTMGLIKRSGVLSQPQTGGRLIREFGVVDPELPVASWAAGLREKGDICFLPEQEWREDARNISCMIINGDDQSSGMGAAYASRFPHSYCSPPYASFTQIAHHLAGPDGHHVMGSYIPTDKDDKINFVETDEMRTSRIAQLRPEAIHQHEITSMSYHKASQSVVVTSTNPTGPNGSSQSQICIFPPRLSDDIVDDEVSRRYFREEYGGRKPAWMLGGSDSQLRFTSPIRGLANNCTRACPTSSPGQLDAILATSHGVIHLDGATPAMKWITPSPGDHRGGGGASRNDRAMLRDVFSVDYHPSNAKVIYAGCRDARIHRVDMRTPYSETADGRDWYRHQSAVAHVRCLNEHQVLAAGPRSAMAIYDVRWLSPGRRGVKGCGAAAARPVVQFPGYRNAAHLQIGLDVTHDVGGVAGLGCGGVVAAGLDDGTVGVFSLRSGRRLRAGDVDNPGKLKAASGVVKALQFEKMPWEKETSLFVAVGPVVKKFSFGLDDDEEW